MTIPLHLFFRLLCESAKKGWTKRKWAMNGPNNTSMLDEPEDSSILFHMSLQKPSHIAVQIHAIAFSELCHRLLHASAELGRLLWPLCKLPYVGDSGTERITLERKKKAEHD